MMKHSKKQVGEERVYLAYTSTFLFITEGCQDRNSNRAGSQRQELMQRPCRGAIYWVTSHGLFIPPYYRTHDHLSRDSTTHQGLGTPSLITRLIIYGWISQRHFLKCGFFSEVSSLCQVHKQISQ